MAAAANNRTAGAVVMGRTPAPGDYVFNNSTPYDGLWNENDELVSDANFPTQVDAPFPPSELAALQLSDQQWQLVRENSRLRSWRALLEDSMRAARSGSSSRPTRATGWSMSITRPFWRTRITMARWIGEANGNGVLDAGPRYKEFSDVTPASGLSRFPPKFGTTGGTTAQV
ncbi:MAG: hypothetical protein U0992_04125 [Planctomycetaceae bacterium]